MTVEVWWASLTAASHHLLAPLDPSERARVESLERPADRGRSLVGAALLRGAVAARLGLAPAGVRVDRTCAECGGPHGAPRVLNPEAADLAVSVSHSGVLVVVALREHGPVGVDVQRVADLPGAAGPASPADPLDSAAAERWVRHEAALKADSAARAAGHPTLPESLEAEDAVRMLTAPLPGYVAALATPSGAAGAAGDPVCRTWPGFDTGPGPGVGTGAG
jgi:4'-phosphopantetheinyl transferase